MLEFSFSPINVLLWHGWLSITRKSFDVLVLNTWTFVALEPLWINLLLTLLKSIKTGSDERKWAPALWSVNWRRNSSFWSHSGWESNFRGCVRRQHWCWVRLLTHKVFQRQSSAKKWCFFFFSVTCVTNTFLLTLSCSPRVKKSLLSLLYYLLTVMHRYVYIIVYWHMNETLNDS